MSDIKNKMRKRLKILLGCFAIVLLLCTGTFYIYTMDYSRAQDEAVAVMTDSHTKLTTFDGGVAFGDVGAQNGFIFYPGGKVEYSAYAPLLQSIAEAGTLCVVAEMPLNLAVFDSNAAEKIILLFPEIEHWFIGGHSLGGAMAADYTSKSPYDFKGLILLAAYPTKDLSSCEFGVLSIYGSNDTVLNAEKFVKGRNFMPAVYKEICIDGGNHAQFGDYGLQVGDGAASITPEKQREITAKAILDFIQEGIS